jgi:hypothetical protein
MYLMVKVKNGKMSRFSVLGDDGIGPSGQNLILVHVTKQQQGCLMGLAPFLLVEHEGKMATMRLEDTTQPPPSNGELSHLVVHLLGQRQNTVAFQAHEVPSGEWPEVQLVGVVVDKEAKPERKGPEGGAPRSPSSREDG